MSRNLFEEIYIFKAKALRDKWVRQSFLPLFQSENHLVKKAYAGPNYEPKSMKVNDDKGTIENITQHVVDGFKRSSEFPSIIRFRAISYETWKEVMHNPFTTKSMIAILNEVIVVDGENSARIVNAISKHKGLMLSFIVTVLSVSGYDTNYQRAEEELHNRVEAAAERYNTYDGILDTFVYQLCNNNIQTLIDFKNLPYGKRIDILALVQKFHGIDVHGKMTQSKITGKPMDFFNQEKQVGGEVTESQMALQQAIERDRAQGPRKIDTRGENQDILSKS